MNSFGLNVYTLLIGLGVVSFGAYLARSPLSASPKGGSEDLRSSHEFSHSDISFESEKSNLKVAGANKERKFETTHESAVPESARLDSESEKEPRGEGSQSLKMQFASAIREGETGSLNHFLSQEFGLDSELDGLLIEGARTLALSGTAQNIEKSLAKLSEFYHFEVHTRSPQVLGNQIQIAEALGDVVHEGSIQALLEIIEDPMQSRVVKGSAVMSLGQLGAKSGLATLRSYNEALLREAKNATGEEKGFIKASQEELMQVIESLSQHDKD